MAVKKKQPQVARESRPRTVDVKDPLAVHAAISSGKLPLNAAPIDLAALARWAVQEYVPEGPAHGLEIKLKELK